MQTNETKHLTSSVPQNETNVTADDSGVLKQNETKNSNSHLIEGDMILNDSSAAEASAVYTDKKWPNANIPFEISNEYSKRSHLNLKIVFFFKSDFF